MTNTASISSFKRFVPKQQQKKKFVLPLCCLCGCNHHSSYTALSIQSSATTAFNVDVLPGFQFFPLSPNRSPKDGKKQHHTEPPADNDGLMRMRRLLSPVSQPPNGIHFSRSLLVRLRTGAGSVRRKASAWPTGAHLPVMGLVAPVLTCS